MVAPGFVFENLKLAKRDELIALFPQHEEIIERLTAQ
jgi:predicted cupin superfamily sugar epimerase